MTDEPIVPGPPSGGLEALLDELARFAQSVGTARDLRTIYHALREFALVAVPCIGIFISLYDAERDVRLAVYGWADGIELDVSNLPPMAVTSGPNSLAVRTGEVVVTNDDDRARKGNPNVLIETGVDARIPQSSLVSPMAVMGRIVGTVDVQSYERGAYAPEHAATLRFASALAAVAIENFRLLERETRARAMAEESNRLKDEFLATLSHELRTPLNAIVGWTEMLRGGRLDATETERALASVARNARAEAKLVSDVLDVSRIITGKLELERTSVVVRDVVETAIEAVRPAASAKRLQLRTTIDAPSATVGGDFGRLVQVVTNVLSNAVKFTPSGGRIDVEQRSDGDSVAVVVTDTGCGIESAFLPHVFDRFRQADSSTRREHGGLGLGLSIVQRVTELHGGSVSAASDGAGRGAVFTVRLPRLIAPEAEGALRGGEAGVNAELAGLDVLVVDDDAETLAMLRAALMSFGARPRAVGTADEALDELERAAPDVLVSDIGMPGTDGLDLIRAVRARSDGGAIPALALTAYAGVEDGARALAAGYDARLVKPADLVELVTTIRRLTAARG